MWDTDLIKKIYTFDLKFYEEYKIPSSNREARAKNISEMAVQSDQLECLISFPGELSNNSTKSEDHIELTPIAVIDPINSWKKPVLNDEILDDHTVVDITNVKIDIFSIDEI